MNPAIKISNVEEYPLASTGNIPSAVIEIPFVECSFGFFILHKRSQIN